MDQRMGSWFSDAVHDVAGWAVGNGNEPGTPMSRAGQISDADLAAALANATAAQPPQGVTVKQTLLMGAGGLALLMILRRR